MVEFPSGLGRGKIFLSMREMDVRGLQSHLEPCNVLVRDLIIVILSLGIPLTILLDRVGMWSLERQRCLRIEDKRRSGVHG